MKGLQTVICFLLLSAIPALAADSTYGVWRMRPDPGSQGPGAQVVTVEPSGGGVQFSYDIDAGGQHIQYEFVTKMDGALVPATSQRTSPLACRSYRGQTALMWTPVPAFSRGQA